MPGYAGALAFMVVPACVLWLAWHVMGRVIPNQGAFTLPLLAASLLWGGLSPILVPLRRRRKFGARSRLVFDEVIASYGVMLVAAFLITLVLVAIG